ncbi:MAG: alpha-amylase family glycosyl hydrolase, partial [Dermatophilaceae bacterium]
MSDLLKRRETRFVLWCPSAPANPPQLVIGQIQNGNPPIFNQLARRPLQRASDAGTPIDGLWELDPATVGLADGQTYHYWFEVDNTSPGGSGRIQVTDPLASTVDYRLLAPANRSLSFPASVIGFSGGKLVPRDPNGEQGNPTLAPFTALPTNNQTVIYELPTAWSSFTGSDEFQRAVGTFRDVRALTEPGVTDLNFSELTVTKLNPPYLVQLGVNALEMLPAADSIYSRQWGYGTSHYLAPDYELGYPEGFLSPTANRDLADLIGALHDRGIRVLLDVVLGFMKEEPYRYIDFDDFYLEDPLKHPGDPDAASSRFNREGNKELRNPFGGSCPRYVRTRTTYDPISGQVKTISPARQHMLTFLTRWMRDFTIDGIRMDSVENVANWDFVEEFKDTGHDLFAARYPAEAAADKYIVVGEELTLPRALLDQHRLDGLWNERFQTFIRAVLAGENAAEEPSFEWTVRRAIDCQIADHLTG